MPDKLNQLRREVRQLVKTKPKVIVAERFVARPGMGMGNSAEIINLFLGVLLEQSARVRIPLILVMPSVHKGWLKSMYSKTAQELYLDLNKHQADARAMAEYVWKKLKGEW